MNVAMLLAGGRGVRFGAALPKQFTPVLGRPVMAYALLALQRCGEIDAIQLVCRDEYAALAAGIARENGVDKLRWIVPAGESCPLSIRSGVLALSDALKADDALLIQMAVSPLVTQADITSALRVCRERGCCFTMHPANLCLARRGGEGWAGADAPKEDYVELTTPWAFRYGDVLSLYRRLDEQGRALGESEYTLGLWLAEGRRAWYAQGSEEGRLKITTAHDLDLFEGLLRLRLAREEEATGGDNA